MLQMVHFILLLTVIQSCRNPHSCINLISIHFVSQWKLTILLPICFCCNSISTPGPPLKWLCNGQHIWISKTSLYLQNPLQSTLAHCMKSAGNIFTNSLQLDLRHSRGGFRDKINIMYRENQKWQKYTEKQKNSEPIAWFSYVCLTLNNQFYWRNTV